ncbi:hypothetical protein V8C35DRAFT_276808 [Trichoderma chlorosporum]
MTKAMFTTWASAFLCLSFSGGVAASPTVRERTTDLRALLIDLARQWAANTAVSFPGSDIFNNVTELYSIFNQLTYSAVVNPGTEADIGKVSNSIGLERFKINLATTRRLPFLARGAGHGGANMSDPQSGVSLDLSKFNSITIDSAAQTMTVGSGVHYRDIFDPLYNAGFYMQTGRCSCPSVIGVAIGGGVGRLMKYPDSRGCFQELFVYDPEDGVTAQGAATYGSQLRSQFSNYSGYSTPTVFVNYARGELKMYMEQTSCRVLLS